VRVWVHMALGCAGACAHHQGERPKVKVGVREIKVVSTCMALEDAPLMGNALAWPVILCA